MAKTLQHPDFPTLTIIVAETVADKPIPGKFFVTHATVNLSDVASKAYGAPGGGETLFTRIKRINRSQYNRKRCFYRFKSDDCYSGRVNADGALTTNNFGPGAWLSLCNADKAGTDGLGLVLGTKYQVIWIPTADSKEPQDLVSPQPEPLVTEVPHIPDLEVIVPPDKPGFHGVETGVVGQIGVPVTGDPASSLPGDETAPAIGQVKKSGVGWVLAAILGLGAIGTVIYFAGKDKKKGKRR